MQKISDPGSARGMVTGQIDTYIRSGQFVPDKNLQCNSTLVNVLKCM